jgi:hypothetical protein
MGKGGGDTGSIMDTYTYRYIRYIISLDGILR